MNYRILDAEAEDVDVFEDRDLYDSYGEGDVDGYYDYESEEAEEGWGWPDERGAFEVMEVANYPEDDWSEDWAEYEPDSASDFAEMAEALRETLHEDYRDASPEQMEDALYEMLAEMTPAEGFNFGKVLSSIGSVGKQVLRDPSARSIAGSVLPVAGGALGTFIGGPVGTAVGSQLGQLAGRAVAGGQRPRRPSSRRRGAGISRQRGARASARGGSTAAAQLLQLTQNPAMLQSLLSLSLGSSGRRSVKAGRGGPSVPVGAFANLLGQLAGQAAADADALLRESEEGQAYLLDSEGEYLVDPADSTGRAEALYETLVDAENQQLIESIAEEYAEQDEYESFAGEARYRRPHRYHRRRPRLRARRRRRLRRGRRSPGLNARY